MYTKQKTIPTEVYKTLGDLLLVFFYSMKESVKACLQIRDFGIRDGVNFK